MNHTFDVDHVVLDIEGTTSATGFVVDELYPYSRKRFGRLLTERAEEPAVRRAVAQIRELLAEPGADAARIERALGAWLDEDRKVTPLKTLQGIVWAEGFANGELVSHFYPDVVPRLRAWHAAGVRLHVYSSGSVAAQRAWFGHSPEGDLRTLADRFYDTENAGPKLVATSYETIAADPEPRRTGCCSCPTGPGNWTRHARRGGARPGCGGPASRTTRAGWATIPRWRRSRSWRSG
ncbi:Enolase-phosphatase E1 [Streptomyces rimosus subsp. rimosus]|uniref:Enolase-phosphatase E1 n=1 Tax=Streptomyces rimosus subsp. rimosus TaxID=132474 RepID=A0ABY3Z9R3_STRRM|nr:Enolase-phosphatase E1 [Streptomyces rimosus subsp. rimosus]UTH98500.1 Enolase-phosphatase E1 [Streptomyces rimosus subsp. rimosus]UTJ16599.1 Enolase-phosphatase E1 [Streptomyces rimosus subsp. rimosus]